MAIFTDLNPRIGESSLGELLFDVDAVNGSIENILGTAVGERWYFPEFGAQLRHYLHEPIDDITSLNIRNEVITILNIWDQRIRVLASASVIARFDNNLAGYDLFLPYYYVGLTTTGNFSGFLRQLT